MKSKFLIGTFAFVLSATISFADKPLALNEVPAAVRQTINQQNVEVKQIKREVMDGKTVYQVKTKQKGSDKEIYIREDGSIVSDTAKGRGKGNSKGKNKSERDEVQTPAPAPPASTPTPVPAPAPAPVQAPKPVVAAPTVPVPTQTSLILRDLPVAVQQTVRKAAGSDGKVIDIDKQTVAGKTIYQVEYTTGENRYQMAVAEDGTRIDRVASKAIPFKSLPAAVQKTAKTQMGSSAIIDVDQNVVNGKSVYKLTFLKNKVKQQIQIAEDGTLLP